MAREISETKIEQMQAVGHELRLFGTEIASAASSRSRAFSLGDSVLELISAPANPGSAIGRGLVYIRIAVKDFSVEAATRILRERGIENSAARGAVHRDAARRRALGGL